MYGRYLFCVPSIINQVVVVSHKFTDEGYQFLIHFVQAMTTINTEALRLFESLNRKQYELETKVTALKNITDSAKHQEYTTELRNGVKELAKKIEVGVGLNDSNWLTGFDETKQWSKG